MSNWDTEETGRVIANDEWLYDLSQRLATRSNSTSRLADKLELEVEPLIKEIEWCTVDTENIDWLAVAVEIMEEAEG